MALTDEQKQALAPVPERDEPPCESMAAELRILVKDMEVTAAQAVTLDNLRDSMTAMFEAVMVDLELALRRDGS